MVKALATPPTHAELEAKLEAKRNEIGDRFPPKMELRMQRAISWIEGAERYSDDLDMRFLCLWIAFNAAYSNAKTFYMDEDKAPNERDTFNDFVKNLIRYDSRKRIKTALWSFYPEQIQSLISNKFVFAPFWRHQENEGEYANWKSIFEDKKKKFDNVKQSGNVPAMLDHIFRRLYDARNQIMHGHARRIRGRNRDQLGDGADILGYLVPILIDIMLEHPEEDWGEPHYTLRKNS